MINFFRIWLGFFLVLLGDHFSMFALPIIIYHQSQSLFAAGLAYAIEWLPRLFITPLGGIVVDKWGARKTIILIDVVKFFCGFIGYALLDAQLLSPYLVGGILAAVISVGTSQTLVACESLVSKNYTGNDYLKKTSAMTFADQSTMLLGPILGIFLYQFFEVKYLILVSTLFYLFSAVNMLTLKISDYMEVCDKGVLKNLTAGIKVMRQFPVFIAVGILNSLLNMTSGLVEASSVVMTKSHFNLSYENFGVLNLAAGLAGSLSLLGVPWMLKKITARTITTAALSIFCAVCLLINYFLNHFYAYVILYGLSIGATILSSLYFKELRNRLVPVQHQGKVIANMSFLSYISLPISGLIVGSLGHISDVAYYIGAFGLSSLVLGFLILVMSKNEERLLVGILPVGE